MKLSSMKKTWILDLDGTLLTHNGHKNDEESLLPGVSSFFDIIKDDFVVIMTARDESLREKTEFFLEKNKIKYDQIIFGVPFGERIVVNDEKPGGLKTAHAISVLRNQGLQHLRIEIDTSI